VKVLPDKAVHSPTQDDDHNVGQGAGYNVVVKVVGHQGVLENNNYQFLGQSRNCHGEIMKIFQ
jgi:hypothetical protein